MQFSPRLRDRLPGILVALALHAGLFALLVLSLQFVRRQPPEKETTLFLPPLPRPTPAPALVIDGRRTPPRATSIAPPPPQSAPPAATPPAAAGDTAILRGLGGLVGGKRPGEGMARQGPRDLTPPDPKIKDESYWAAEREAAHAPLRVPCTSLETTTIGMGPIQKNELGVRLDLKCLGKELADWGNSGKPQFNPPANDPDAGHASEAAFRQALAAVQARKYALYGKPAPLTAGAAP